MEIAGKIGRKFGGVILSLTFFFIFPLFLSFGNGKVKGGPKKSRRRLCVCFHSHIRKFLVKILGGMFVFWTEINLSSLACVTCKEITL